MICTESGQSVEQHVSAQHSQIPKHMSRVAESSMSEQSASLIAEATPALQQRDEVTAQQLLERDESPAQQLRTR